MQVKERCFLTVLFLLYGYIAVKSALPETKEIRDVPLSLPHRFRHGRPWKQKSALRFLQLQGRSQLCNFGSFFAFWRWLKVAKTLPSHPSRPRPGSAIRCFKTIVVNSRLFPVMNAVQAICRNDVTDVSKYFTCSDYFCNVVNFRYDKDCLSNWVVVTA